tara:strand:+ start:1709 stop:1885 length:177 start_codon:yes stop_codon:yes gene_type:complete
MPSRADLERDIAAVLNKHSVEGITNTPDFVLAKVAVDALTSFQQGILKRDALAQEGQE